MKFDVANEQRWPQRVLIQRLIVQRTSFNRDSVTKLFSQVVENEGKNYPVIKVEVYTDRGAAANNSKDQTDVTYASWRGLFDSYRKRIPQSAQLISVNGDASMRLRDESGVLYNSVIAGKDPTTLLTKSSTLHLADFVSQGIKVGGSDRAELSIMFFYWIPGPYDELAVKEAIDKLIAVTGIRRVTLVAEPWPWFVSEEEFPILYPYSASPPPTEEEYYSAYKVTCSTAFGRLGCSTFRRQP